jgi:uncharacterized membrane protein (UPF0127 family)
VTPSRSGWQVLGLLAACSLHAGAPAQELPRAALEVGGWGLQAEIAISPQARATGLGGRTTLPENQGMLFVILGDAQPCMWMKDTPIPLAVAFVDPTGIILNIAEMQPNSLDLHCALGPSGYALEMNAGWFSQRGIGPGARLSGLDAVPR